MTATATQALVGTATATADPGPTPQLALTQETLEAIAIAKIVEAEDCGYERAKEILAYHAYLFERARRSPNRVYVLGRSDHVGLKRPLYEAWERLFPEETTVEPGSVAEAISNALLDPTCGEGVIEHFQMPTGECALRHVIRIGA